MALIVERPPLQKPGWEKLADLALSPVRHSGVEHGVSNKKRRLSEKKTVA
jgi:hypothetical protein